MNDLSGKTALVTGGISGIGRATALHLARRGANVVIVGRDEQKAASLIREGRNSNTLPITFLSADLSEMDQVRQLAAQFRAQNQQLHILVHSAGIHHYQRTRTSDGVEYNFAANYLNRFLLSNLLSDLLRASAPARIVVLGSPYVFDPKRFLTFDDLLRGDRSPLPLWALLKAGMASSVWTVAFARRFTSDEIIINNVRPGIVRTDILRNDPLFVQLLDRLFQPIMGMSAEQGAAAPVYLATSKDVAGLTGAFFKGTRRGIKPAKVPPGTYDQALGERLWAFSEQCTNRSSQ